MVYTYVCMYIASICTTTCGTRNVILLIFFCFIDSSIHWKMHNVVLSVGVDQLVDCLLTEDAKGD